MSSVIDCQYTMEAGSANPYKKVLSSYYIQCHQPIMEFHFEITAPRDIQLTPLITNRTPGSYEGYYIPEKFECQDSYYDIASIYSEANGEVNGDYSLNRKTIFITREDHPSPRETFQELVKHLEKRMVLRKARVVVQ